MLKENRMMTYNKNDIEKLASHYFFNLNVSIDTEVLLRKLHKYKISIDQLEIIFQSIIMNITFFERELSYPLVVSNLFLFEIDARKEPQKKCRGTDYRHILTKLYREILNSQNGSKLMQP